MTFEKNRLSTKARGVMNIGDAAYFGCKICRRPLDCTDPINKMGEVIIKKPNQEKSPNPIPEQPVSDKQKLQKCGVGVGDIEPVAPKCGHMFHRCCIKKLINETASSKVLCPICTKPFVFTQLHPIKFFYLNNTTESMSIRSTVRRMNHRNNKLVEKVDDAKQLHNNQKKELVALIARLEKEKKERDFMENEMRRIKCEFLAMEMNGLSVKDLANDVDIARNRILEISSTNSVLLKNLEEFVAPLNKIKRKQDNLSWLKEIQELFCTKENGNKDNSFKTFSTAKAKHFHLQLYAANGFPFPARSAVVETPDDKPWLMMHKVETTEEVHISLVENKKKITQEPCSGRKGKEKKAKKLKGKSRKLRDDDGNHRCECSLSRLCKPLVIRTKLSSNTKSLLSLPKRIIAAASYSSACNDVRVKVRKQTRGGLSGKKRGYKKRKKKTKTKGNVKKKNGKNNLNDIDPLS